MRAPRGLASVVVAVAMLWAPASSVTQAAGPQSSSASSREISPRRAVRLATWHVDAELVAGKTVVDLAVFRDVWTILTMVRIGASDDLILAYADGAGMRYNEAARPAADRAQAWVDWASGVVHAEASTPQGNLTEQLGVTIHTFYGELLVHIRARGVWIRTFAESLVGPG
ncbi:MAG: hypothetical protein AB7Q00_04530 [Phycisphaerales bacterium]